MIITAPASTIRSAAKRAGFDKAISIRTGRAAASKEANNYVSSDECSVLIHSSKDGVEAFLDWLADKYGFRYAKV